MSSKRNLDQPRGRENGFTMIEMIVVVAILGMLALFAYPALQKMIIRSNLETSARDVSTFFRLARLEGIKNSTAVVVQFDLANRSLSAFADVNLADGTRGSDLIFNPQGGAVFRTTDYEVVPPLRLPNQVDFGGPAADPAAIDGFTLSAGNRFLIFNADGTVADEGGLRFRDTRGNFLEVGVRPRTSGRVQLLKWHLGDATWYTRGRITSGGATEATWEWYV